MRNLVVLVRRPAVLAQGCASAPASNPSTATAPPATSRAKATDPARLPAINDDLAGEPATVELAGGEVVQQARSVRLGTEVTSWQESSGRERTVPTAEVRRVLREQKRLIGRGFGYGAAVALLPAPGGEQQQEQWVSLPRRSLLRRLADRTPPRGGP